MVVAPAGAEDDMTTSMIAIRRFGAALALACAGSLIGASPSRAGGFDEARPMINPRYLKPDISYDLWPACQVMVKKPVRPQFGVTSDDLLYCELPRHNTRFPSDRCACALDVGGVRVLHDGMVVWRPRSWWYVYAPH
jgi:hypothetical protein